MSIPAPLRPFVTDLTAYDVVYAQGAGVHVGMPSTSLTFVLPLGEPLDVSWAGAPKSRSTTWASVSGVHDRPAAIHHSGAQRGVQLTVTAAGSRALFGVPARELAGELLDLADVDPVMGDLPSRLAEAPAAERIDLVWRALGDAVVRHDGPGPRAEVGRALALLTRGAGVTAAAEEVGYSRRWLGRLVLDEVGVSPQVLRRLGRFERSHDLMRRRTTAGSGSLADVAAECGYADHAHMTREWAALAGCTPSTWQRKEFPDVQAIATQAVAGWEHPPDAKELP